MAFDPYVWSKKKIETFVEKIEPLKKDGLKTSPGQIWSIKKLLVLDYYVGNFVRIIRNHPKFKKWYYVDTHSGTGLIDFEDSDLVGERFPGSPFMAAFRNVETPFTDYFLSDSDKESIEVLTSRLTSLKARVGTHNYSPIQRDFETTVDYIENKNAFGIAFLIFIDPTGFSEIRWDLMERLLSIDTADIFFTFMTYSLVLNRSHTDETSTYEDAFTTFYGNESWRECSTGDELVERYVTQMYQHKKFVFDIPVYKTGQTKLYDILIATNSKGAQNIISSAEKIMNVTTTEMMRQALRVATKKNTDLDGYFE